MILLADYWMGRRLTHALSLTPEIEHEAHHTVLAANALLDTMGADGVERKVHPGTGMLITSGWRPPAVNAATAGAAKNSLHMTGRAIDVYDPEGRIDSWCMTHLDLLAAAGLWLEHPDYTPRWSHWQTLAPGSRRRVFIPYRSKP